MSAETRYGGRFDPCGGARSGTKTTKAAKTSKKTSLVFLVLVIVVAFVSASEPSAVPPRAPSAVSPQAPAPAQQPPAQPPPVFRGGAHYVRVDAYPTRNGRIIEGLTKEDFEIFEDGTRQSIEQADFVTFDGWTPDAQRIDPRTSQHAYDLAGDPTWRVFVIVIDRGAFGMPGQHYMRGPLHEFLDRTLGPRDLFGILTTENEWTDLTLGQTTTAAKTLIDSRHWIVPPLYEERMLPLYQCGLGALAGIKRLDDTYTLLEGLVKLLGLVRQERKSIVLVSDGLSSGARAPNIAAMALPEPPVTTLPRGPGSGIPRPGDHLGRGPSRGEHCAAERMRLTGLDFGLRFRDLLRDARQANVAFYPISPSGLQTIPFKERGGGGFDMQAYRAQTARTDSLHTLASQTDGLAIVNTNDLAGGMRRIAADVQAYYVLGYYTSNTKWDGGIRSIKVRLKPKRDTIRARRQYRAPTLEEIAQFSRPPAAPARPAVPAATPGPPALVGEAVAFRLAPRQPAENVSAAEYERTDRLRVEWPVLATLENRQVRMLDRNGKPLPVDLPSAEDASARVIVVELPLAAFARGEYWLELMATANGTSERRVLPLKVR